MLFALGVREAASLALPPEMVAEVIRGGVLII